MADWSLGVMSFLAGATFIIGNVEWSEGKRRGAALAYFWTLFFLTLAVFWGLK